MIKWLKKNLDIVKMQYAIAALDGRLEELENKFKEEIRMKSYFDNWNEANYKIIQDKTIDKEIKLFCIIDMVHSEAISRNKAYELCQEVGLFSDHWCAIDNRLIEIWPNYYKSSVLLEEAIKLKV